VAPAKSRAVGSIEIWRRLELHKSKTNVFKFYRRMQFLCQRASDAKTTLIRHGLQARFRTRSNPLLFSISALDLYNCAGNAEHTIPHNEPQASAQEGIRNSCVHASETLSPRMTKAICTESNRNE
jgi:hypothetical protein